MSKISVGLDYHQSVVQVCVLNAKGKVLENATCENERERIVALVRRHGRKVQAALEACTGAANLADELLSEPGWSVTLAHPGYVARLKQSPDKSDFSDARLLADLVRVGYLPKVWLAPEALRELKRVVRYRQQLVQERCAKKLRIRALLRESRVPSPGRPWTKAWLEWLSGAPLPEQAAWVASRHLTQIGWLNEEIKAVEQRLEALTADDPCVQKLLELPGVGLVTAVTLRAEIGQFERFKTGKQLSRFCGVTPRNASSGERQADAGLIKAGSRELRRVVVQAAHRLMNLEGRWVDFKHQLQRRGKPYCVIVAAVSNRWLRWLYH
jgi:transposase